MATLFRHPDTAYSQVLPKPLILGRAGGHVLNLKIYLQHSSKQLFWQNNLSFTKFSVMMDMMVLNYNLY